MAASLQVAVRLMVQIHLGFNPYLAGDYIIFEEDSPEAGLHIHILLDQDVRTDLVAAGTLTAPEGLHSLSWP